MNRKFTIPPWTVTVILLVYACGLFGAFHTGLALHSVFHFGMAVVSFILFVGLYFRWRLALWVSAFIFAASAGGTVAHKLLGLSSPILYVQKETLLNIAFVFQVAGVTLHQTAMTFRWFGFDQVRKIRPWFWLVVVVAFSVWASIVYFGLQDRTEARKVGKNRICGLPNTALEPTAGSAFSSAARAASRVGGGSAFGR